MFPEKEVIYYNAEVLKANSRKDAINKWFDSQDDTHGISGVIIKDSYTFNEGGEFQETYYRVAGINVSE